MEPKRKEEIKETIIHAVENEFTTLKDAQENFKVVVKAIVDKFSLDPKKVKKLIKWHYEASADEEKEAMDQDYKFYRELLG